MNDSSKAVLKVFGGIVGISIAAGVAAFAKERFDEHYESVTFDDEDDTKSEPREKPHTLGFYEHYLKRPFDATLSMGAIIIFSPILLTTAILVRKRLGSPILFTQDRPGKDEKIFKLYKFKTMTDQRDHNGELLPDEVRLTSFGKILRSTSLDELPELFNMIKGDMAVVGPRPLLVRYLSRYNATQHRRHEVRPGLTGLAQVHGRNTVSWDERFKYDVEYVDNISFLSDCKIILDTVKTVFKQEGISSDTSATMEEFMGNDPEAN